ncbi:MAG: hypothetical protein QNJ51_26135 [Calothrix sp. MO_167.B12]|nr:hypothetical protein [Calothrix sp. MO_167.B12]
MLGEQLIVVVVTRKIEFELGDVNLGRNLEYFRIFAIALVFT